MADYSCWTRHLCVQTERHAILAEVLLNTRDGDSRSDGEITVSHHKYVDKYQTLKSNNMWVLVCWFVSRVTSKWLAGLTAPTPCGVLMKNTRLT